MKGEKIKNNFILNLNNSRNLLLGRKAVTNLDSVSRSRDVTMLTKVRLVKAMVFSSSHV